MADPIAPLLGALSGTGQNALHALSALLAPYGLQSFAPAIMNFTQQGYDPTTSYYLMQQTPEWTTRFHGNELLKQRGLTELDPGTYLDLESRYEQVLKQAGIPAGQYGRSDFANWIGGSVAPTEIQDRVNLASSAVQNSDPFFKNALSALGIDNGHLTAYYLDQSRAEPYLTHQFQAAQIGAEALRNNLQFDPNTALALASMGVTQGQAQQGYSQIAKMLPRLGQLSGITPGATFDQGAAERDVFLGDNAAAQQAFKLANTEEGRFGGSSGVGNNLYHPFYGVGQSLQGSY